MSPKKIIFLVVSGATILLIAIIIITLSNKSQKPTEIPKSMKIWITDGTTEWYASLVEWFKSFAPEYKNTDIIFEKKTTDPIRYRILLLSTLSEWTWPDIFMIWAWTDSVLESKIEPIPEDVLNFSNFEKRYDDIFLPLIVSTWSKDSLKRYILWIPLGFETMWVFYNKALVREVPQTWNELDLLYDKWISPNVFPTNLWLGPRYTQNASEVIALFLGKSGITNLLSLKSGTVNEFNTYVNYKNAKISWGSNPDDIYSPSLTLMGKQESMEAEKGTTLDMFMRGEIWLILWYPSLISELEKSDKRAWSDSVASTILTEKIPLEKPTDWRINIAKYDFFALSKWTKNPTAWVKFMEYLMTQDAQKRFLESNPYTIAAQHEFWTAQEKTKISPILSRAWLDAFIPDIDEELFVFWYWLKSEFDSFLSEYLDRSNNLDINNIINTISHDISCSIDTYTWVTGRTDCEKNK